MATKKTRRVQQSKGAPLTFQQSLRSASLDVDELAEEIRARLRTDVGDPRRKRAQTTARAKKYADRFFNLRPISTPRSEVLLLAAELLNWLALDEMQRDPSGAVDGVIDRETTAIAARLDKELADEDAASG